MNMASTPRRRVPSAITVPISLVRSNTAMDNVLEMLSTTIKAISSRTTPTWRVNSSTVLL